MSKGTDGDELGIHTYIHIYIHTNDMILTKITDSLTSKDSNFEQVRGESITIGYE